MQTTNIDIIRAIQFIEDNQKIDYSRIFAFTTEAPEESSIFKKYLDFADVFLKLMAKELLLYRDIGLEMVQEPGPTPLFGPIYKLLELKLKKLKSYSKEKFMLRIMKPSKSYERALIF